MPKNYPDWLRQATNPSLPVVIAIGGEERAFVDEALSEIKNRFLGSALAEFNCDFLSAKSASLDAILMAAKNLPVMSAQRLVFVKDAEAIKSDDLSKFESYLSSPNQSTVLVFVFDWVDIRLKFQKLLDSKAAFFKFDHPKEREMLGLIKARAKARGLQIDDDCSLSLYLELGNSLLMLDRAFEKLELSCVDKRVTQQHIADQVAQTAFEDAFVLARAVAMKDRTQVAKSLCALKKAQEIPLRLLGLIAWQFRVILKARLMLDDKRSASEIGSKLNLFGDRVEFVIRAARLLNRDAQIKRLASLLDLDRALKSSRAPAWLNFDRSVLELTDIV